MIINSHPHHKYLKRLSFANFLALNKKESKKSKKCKESYGQSEILEENQSFFDNQFLQNKVFTVIDKDDYVIAE